MAPKKSTKNGGKRAGASKRAREIGELRAAAALQLERLDERPGASGDGGDEDPSRILLRAFAHALEIINGRERPSRFEHNVQGIFEQLVLSLQVGGAAPYVRKQLGAYADPFSTRAFRDAGEWGQYLELFGREMKHAREHEQLYAWTLIGPATLGMGAAFGTAVLGWARSEIPTGDDASELTDEVKGWIARVTRTYAATVAP